MPIVRIKTVAKIMWKHLWKGDPVGVVVLGIDVNAPHKSVVMTSNIITAYPQQHCDNSGRSA